MDALFRALTAHVRAHRIDVREESFPPDIPAAFNGRWIALNPRHDRASLCWYLVHSFGSIAGWSLDVSGVTAMFHELRDAKATRDTDRARLERAIARFREFEERSSRYSVWTLDQLGHPSSIDPFTLFFRADLEAMTIFHREGRAPVWKDFLATWEREVAAGTRSIAPFDPLPLPPFTPREFEKQEVKQEL